MNSTSRHSVLLLLLVSIAATVQAHPVPFSYIDVRIDSAAIDLTVVVHTFDLANDLKVQPPERLLERDVLKAHAGAVAQMLRDRLNIAADGEALRNLAWSVPETVPDRQSIR